MSNRCFRHIRAYVWTSVTVCLLATVSFPTLTLADDELSVTPYFAAATLDDLPAQALGGPRIASTTAGGAGDRAGLRVDDIILSVNGRRIFSYDEFWYAR
ncbi:MAG: PDZ domain-containing protein, partial [Planctomycetales bacterium]|nr:PDZ domain-containing protein [Planctomycetales bacterium]